MLQRIWLIQTTRNNAVNGTSHVKYQGLVLNRWKCELTKKKTFVKSFFCRICAKFWTSQKVSLQHSLAKWPMFVLLVFKSRQGGTCTRSVVGMGILNHILILWIELLLFSGIWFFYLEFSDMVIILATTIKKKSNYFLFLPKFLYHKVRVLAPFKRMTEFKIKIKKEIVLSLSRGWIKTIGENPH